MGASDVPNSQNRVAPDDSILMIREAQAGGLGLLRIPGLDGERNGDQAEPTQVAAGQGRLNIVLAELRECFVMYADLPVP